MANQSQKTLFVAIGHESIGRLQFDPDQDQFSFDYSSSWQQQGFAISPHIPLLGKASSIAIKRFIENLFPEGTLLDLLLEQFRISHSNVFAIIQLLGGETTGALQFSALPISGAVKTSFREVTVSELIERLDHRQFQSLVIWDNKPRLSVAGVQDKLPITILSDKRMGFGEGDIASTYILKFQRNNTTFPYLVLNEFFCMELAKKIGLPVANLYFKKLSTHPTLFVERFDRILMSDSLVKRLHIIDGCQALNLSPSYKYERPLGRGRDVAHLREGASLPKLFEFCEHCTIPAVEKSKLLDWVIFNLCISNSDFHGKNLSYFIDEQGIRLGPFYDLLNTAIYPAVESDLALAIGSEFDPNGIHAFQLADFAEECAIDRRFLFNHVKTITTDILKQIDHVLVDQELMMSIDEKDFLMQLKRDIVRKTQKIQNCLNDLMTIQL